jgi:hypothetical protein
MLVDTGAVVNIMPYSVLRRLGQSTRDLIKANVTLSDFNGQASEAQGVLSMDLTIGNKTVPTSFFIVNSKSTYNVLIGSDWIHTNCCIPSRMHQCLIQWDGDEVEVVHADDSTEYFVRRFISNLSGRIEPFMELVKIKANEEFCWGAEQQQAFEEIKEYLSKPPVLVPPQQDRLFYVYLSVGDTSIASVVIQVHDNKERVVFYLSRRMLDAETRYPDIKKLCLCQFFTCTKLHHILLSAKIIIICKSDVRKHMLSVLC